MTRKRRRRRGLPDLADRNEVPLHEKAAQPAVTNNNSTEDVARKDVELAATSADPEHEEVLTEEEELKLYKAQVNPFPLAVNVGSVIEARALE